MKYKFPLVKALIVKRYKRFFAEVSVGHETITVHVPNTGPMIGTWAEGRVCYIQPKENPKLLTHGAELVEVDGQLVGINTQIPNKLFLEAFNHHKIEFLKEYSLIKPEYKIGDSKLDFFLPGEQVLPDCFVEIKNCSGKVDDLGFFPDTKSERAVKHLEELISLKSQGKRTVLVFIIQREDVLGFTSGDFYHPEYGLLLKKAIDLGVEVYAYNCLISLTDITLKSLLPIKLN